jgi:hypothetical protein
MAIGQYFLRFDWQQRGLAKDTATGEDVEIFTSQQKVWGFYDNKPSLIQDLTDALQSTSKVRIVLRNVVDVAPRDHLVGIPTGEVFLVDIVQWEPDSTICTARLAQNI